MANESKNDPAKKMRNLLGASGNSPMKSLPRKDEAAPSFLPAEETAEVDLTRTLPHSAAKPVAAPKSNGRSIGPAFWTFASILSLIMNGVLILLVLILLINMRNFSLGSALNMGNSLLGGLYTNFEKMDRASIKTDVQVDTTIPVKFDLQLNQQTNVVLS